MSNFSSLLGESYESPSYYKFTSKTDVWIRTGDEDTTFVYRGYKILRPIWNKISANQGDYLFILKNGLFFSTLEDEILVECKPYEPVFDPNLIRISNLDRPGFDSYSLEQIEMPLNIQDFRFSSYAEAEELQKNKLNHE